MAVKRFVPWIPVALIACVAIVIAWSFAVTTLRVTPSMGLPLDDSYIYLTYAKQFGRGEPFTYYSGGGYSAGSTSLLWPMVLAPFWTLGARGHALVWVSYLMCVVLYIATCCGVWRVVRRISGDLAGVLAALMLLAVGAMAWTALSGMEVAFASALLVAMILLLLEQSPTGPPLRRLAVTLAAASLSRPEAMVIVFGVVALATLQRLRQRDLRAAGWWCAPLVAPLLWLLANRLFAGQFFPNTGVAKSHFYLPGFDWSYWRETVWSMTGRMFKHLFWEEGSPLVWPKLVALAWLAGAARTMLWAHRNRRLLAGALIVLAPLALMIAVVATTGFTGAPWSFQNYRYIAPTFPLIFICVGVALGRPDFRDGGTQYAWVLATIVAAIAFGVAGAPTIATNARLFAQGAMDTNTQVVAIGEYIHAKLPRARVMFHDAGAIAYYGDGEVYDMLGLVTNRQAGIANHGPGARFEFLESLPPDKRPTHFAYYPGWLGTAEFYGEVLFHTPLKPALEKQRLVGDGDMQIIVANFDHANTGEVPLEPHTGWRVVDRLDIADIASERAHDWHGALGPRHAGDPTAHWSFVGRDVGPAGLVLDGGRTIRGGTERFSITVDPSKPIRLIFRTGGLAQYPFGDDAPIKAVTLRILDDRDYAIAQQRLPQPTGRFVEAVFDLPAGMSVIRTEAPGPYHAFHWFVLQPE